MTVENVAASFILFIHVFIYSTTHSEN